MSNTARAKSAVKLVDLKGIRKVQLELPIHTSAFYLIKPLPSGSVLKVNLPFIGPFSISFHFSV